MTDRRQTGQHGQKPGAVKRRNLVRKQNRDAAHAGLEEGRESDQKPSKPAPTAASQTPAAGPKPTNRPDGTGSGHKTAAERLLANRQNRKGRKAKAQARSKDTADGVPSGEARLKKQDTSQRKAKAGPTDHAPAAMPEAPKRENGDREDQEAAVLDDSLHPVILHIGGHKTGSSSVQALMNKFFTDPKNTSVGFYYPRIFKRYSGQHSDISRLIKTGALDELHTALKSAADAYSTCKNKQLVMSGEDLSAMSLQEVKALRTAFERAGLGVSKIIYCYRERESFIRSSLVQHMKGDRYFVSPARFAERIKTYSPASVIERFSSVFGSQRVIAFEMVSGMNAVEAFAEKSGVKLPVESGGGHKNKSLDFGVAAWANAVNLTHQIDPGLVQMVSDQTDWPETPASVDLTLDEVWAHIDGNPLPEPKLNELGPKRPIKETVAYLNALSNYYSELAIAVERRAKKNAGKD